MYISGKGIKSIHGMIFLFTLIMPLDIISANFSVSFKDVDIKEFINSVSKNINKTIIIDPTVQGLISIRSYENLDKDTYYQLFLNVLDVYGYAAIEMPHNVLKVISSKRAKGVVAPLPKEGVTFDGDELINRVIPLRYISAKKITPLLRQLNDNTESGSIINYDPSNILLITGRAAVVNRLHSIVTDLDQAGDNEIELYKLNYAIAADVVKIVNEAINPINNLKQEVSIVGKVIADERTNSILISGDTYIRKKSILMIKKLDKRQSSDGNTKVVYMKYAQASKLLDVLNGISEGFHNEKKTKQSNQWNQRPVAIKAYDQTNALVITADPDMMLALGEVIEKLDIRRAQVLVEAIIVETQNGEGINLGVKWENKRSDDINFIKNSDGLLNNNGWGIATTITGLTAGFYKGNWDVLLSALSTNTNNNILATPSIVTLDNMEAEFNVGQEVPVLISTQTTTTDKVYNSISRQSIGVMLKVKPQINKGDSVLLEIRQEVSSIADSSTVNTHNLGSVFNKRVVNNAVLVKSRETVVVGGLLDKKSSTIVNKVPFLGDLPLIGWLFRQTKEKVEKSNLILFIKPTILRESDDYSVVTSKEYNKYKKDNMNGYTLADDIVLSDKKYLSVIPSIRKDINNFYTLLDSEL
ncbi:type II secretion system secretin GspD [Yersinia pseudotuberculosis]|uniref:type II secretion system secretin GspD n=1 Tax=Yersinia pseudotuberculosis TaxID=633 RepID=UPI0003461131|nr:type II secretion system secretin GspD [Yersinia pseudotuberculosis]